MIKRILKALLGTLNLGLIGEADLRIYNELSGENDKGLAIPLSAIRIVSKSFLSRFQTYIETVPDMEQLPQSAILNWKPIEDRTLVKQSALDYRAEISSNQYARAYRSPLQGRISVSRGRTWWRLETMRQIRKSNPDIFRGKVIEVGAGTGIVSSTLSNFPEIEQMHCLDYDEHTVEHLMPLVQYSLGANAAKITRIIGSYNNMDAPDASYDAALAVGAMHHSEDLEATFSECFRLLKPGGHFIVTDYALTNDLSHDEYSMLMNKPVSEEEARKYMASGRLSGIRTNMSISEHARPLFLYQAAAFKAGFDVTTYVFDATTNSGGHLARLLRYRETIVKKAAFYGPPKSKREHGYDSYGNVKSFSMAQTIYYPFYAQNVPPALGLYILRDRAGKPVYDNVVLILRKPEQIAQSFQYRYPSGNCYQLPSQELVES